MVCRVPGGWRVWAACHHELSLTASDTKRYARRVLSSRVQSGARRAAACWVCLVLALALGGVGAPVGLAAGLGGTGALNELTEGEPETSTTPTTSTSAVPSETTNSRSLIFLALGAAVLVLSAIAFVIVRDARRRAPAGDPEVLERESAQDQAIKLQRRRAKAKAARKQRKRTRQ
jgi:ABC-type Fe3+ transport system permease subunit